ncbi:MAG: undecaprenyl-diphosphate phosphatase [Candidatus Hodarchaeales archaeon]
MDLLELLFVSVLQGIVEWMPISSEGQSVLLVINFLKIDLVAAISLALFLHLGTMAVVLFVYRREFTGMVISLYPGARESSVSFVGEGSLGYYRKIFLVLLVVTAGTAMTAIPSVFFVEDIWNYMADNLGVPVVDITSLFIGLLLIATGGFLLYQKSLHDEESEKLRFDELSLTSAFILGLFQGLAAMPGISRSGITITVLLFMNLHHSEALKGSFLSSVPASLGATGLLFLRGDIEYVFSEGVLRVSSTLSFTFIEIALALIVVFVTGLLSMVFLLKIAKKIPYWQFCMGLGIIVILAVITGAVFG